MVDLSAQNSLDDNGYTTTDITLIVAERIIDRAISYLNLKTGRSISLMSGTAGVKVGSCSEDEYAVLEAIITCMMREKKKTSLTNSSATGSSAGTSKAVTVGHISSSDSSSVSTSINAASAINSPGNTIYRDFIMEGILSLRATEIDVSRG